MTRTGSQSFGLALSKVVTPAEASSALAKIIPPGLRIDIGRSIDELDSQPGAVWAVVHSTDDPGWPCILDFLKFANECGLGSYPDLRIANWLFRHHHISSLCFSLDFVEGLDPHDPYWSLAHIEGEWFLASTCGMAFMGPCTDGVAHFAGNEKLQLIRRVKVPEEIFA